MANEGYPANRARGAAAILAALASLGPSGCALPDDVFAIKGSVDATKLARFEVDGLTTATTRIYTLPNADTTLAGLAVAQTFSAAQTFGSTIAVTGAATMASTLAVTGRVTCDYLTMAGFSNTAHTFCAGGVNGTLIVHGTGSTYDFAVQNTAGSVAIAVPTGTQNLKVLGVTPSTSPTTGSLTVGGGAGFAGAIFVAGGIDGPSINLTSTGTSCLIVAGQANLAKNLVFSGAGTFPGNNIASIYREGTTEGLVIAGFNGTTNALTVYNNLGQTALRIPVGTTTVALGGALTVTGASTFSSSAVFNAAQGALFNNAAGSYCTWQHNGTSVGDAGPANQIVTGATADFAISSRAGQFVLGTNATARITIAATGGVTFASTSPVTISNATASTSPTTGALIVNGGAGFSGRLFTTASDFHHFAVPSGSVQMRLERTGTSVGSAYIGGDSAGFNVYAQATSQKRMVVDDTAVAGQTALMIYDVDNLTLERVTVGAPDSGGVGFKLLRIPN